MLNKKNQSPFHKGEKAIQTQLGVRDRMERFGQRVIRDHMPEQHQEFYRQLPFIIIGHADHNGFPWASILFKHSGLLQSPDKKHLIINSRAIKGDPLASTLDENYKQGKQTKLGILGIELNSRRRNRLAVHVSEYSQHKIELEVDQSFGNCPKYIQARDLTFISKEDHQQHTQQVQQFSQLDAKATQLIENSDTFFIASYIEDKGGKDSEGADVSHRGGKPGFVQVNNNTLIIPDYQGNYYFNTLGNILENPKAGLLFIDFDSGDVLMLSGAAHIIWESEEMKTFEGAHRLLKFTLGKGLLIRHALPFKWTKAEQSPFL